jgi:hypothetical protein
VLGNPKGDSGTLTLKRGDQVLFVEALDNFRDLDFHFIAPIVVAGGQSLAVDIDCQNGARTTAGETGGATTEAAAAAATGATPATAAPCTAAAYVAGFTAQAKTKKKG